MQTTHATNESRHLTIDEKRSLYHDGYIVVKNAVAEELVNLALAALKLPQRGK